MSEKFEKLKMSTAFSVSADFLKGINNTEIPVDEYKISAAKKVAAILEYINCGDTKMPLFDIDKPDETLQLIRIIQLIKNKLFIIIAEKNESQNNKLRLDYVSCLGKYIDNLSGTLKGKYTNISQDELMFGIDLLHEMSKQLAPKIIK